MLYQLLTDQAAEGAFDSDRRQGRARLSRLADTFVAALESLDVYGPASREAAEKWAAAGISNSTLPEVERRIFHCVLAAKEARDKGHPVFAWEGPAVPEYVLVRGSAHETRDPG